MSVWRKKSVRNVLKGHRVPAGTPGAKKRSELSKRFYGTLRLADGRLKQVPLTEDRDTSRQLLRRLQTEEDQAKALGLVRSARERLKPLSELLTEYERELRSRANTDFHVTRTIECVHALFAATEARTASELDAGRIGHVLAEWRQTGRSTKRKDRRPSPMSVSRSNVYARAIKGFTRWLHTTRRTSEDPLVSLRLLNAKVDRRHVRRALTADDLRRLVTATTASGVVVRRGDGSLTPQDRAWLYTLAAYTGLRASELASLTPESFDLQTMTVTVQAAYSKHRREDVLPLHASLVKPLGAWLTRKHGRVWSGSWAEEKRGASILRLDLKRAGIPYRDSQGRVADFHALRHTFISQLAWSGVHPSVAKELARHSTIVLTMDAYTHAETERLRLSLDALPSLPCSSSHEPTATALARPA